jgi:23S rRNA pseudouridine1911/1915/1917 synthase
MYGGDASGIKRQALHCGSLEFSHPLSGKAIILTSPLPPDILSLFSKNQECVIF